MTLYSVKDVARLFDLAESRLRYWAQTGFVGPSVRQSGRHYYTFQDLVGIKVAKELLASGLPMQRVRKNLEALRRALPDVERPLAQLRVCSDGNELYVVSENGAFQPQSGQLVMSFALDALSAEAAQVVPIAAAAPEPDMPSTAYGCLLAGLEADGTSDARAEACYRHALDQDAALAPAWTNLGALLHRRGLRGQAREALETAIQLDPEQAEARYNLANLLAELGDAEGAVASLRRAIALAPDLADAYFNLATLLQPGSVEARLHLLRYLELQPDGAGADQARAYLAT